MTHHNIPPDIQQFTQHLKEKIFSTVFLEFTPCKRFEASAQKCHGAVLAVQQVCLIKTETNFESKKQIHENYKPQD